MTVRILLLSLFIVFFFSGVTSGQAPNPVKWEFNTRKISDTEIEFSATALMEPGWVIYSQNTEEGGPIPTRFTIGGASIQLEEKTPPTSVFDEMFDMTVLKFKKKAIFSTVIPVAHSRKVQGTVEYMTCDGTRCLPPKEIIFDATY